MRLRNWLVALFVLWPVTVWAQPLPHGIPNLCDSPTSTAKASGSWLSTNTWSTGTIPGLGARVSIPAGLTVSYDAVSPDLRLGCVSSSGSVVFANAAKMRVGTYYNFGVLQIGTASAPITVLTELIIDGTIDLTRDPEQYGVGLLGISGSIVMHGASKTRYVRLASEPKAGQTSISLSSSPINWAAGDRLVIPDTTPGGDEYDVPVVAGTSGSTVTLTAPLKFSHSGMRDLSGAMRFLPHVGNLTRTVVVRSATPTGTRGHVLITGRTAVDIRYTAFPDLGRTTWQPLDSFKNGQPGKNQIGRYSLHLHHHVGPANLPAGTPQFSLIGNAIENGSKWGITIHNSHYGLANLKYEHVACHTPPW